MKRIRSLPSAGWPLLLVTLLGLPLITPLLRWTAVPCTHDGHLHYHRIAAMRHAWENGVYFTRWLPDLAFGYGYPFFIYREPIPLYAGLIPHLLGLPLPAASNLVYIVSILASGWFMYLWVRDVMGRRAGLVSAVAYMAAPYLLVDALIRGNLPESLALPLLPFLLWIGRRWLLSGTTWTFLLSTLGLALLALSHNISLFLFTPVLLLYLLVVGWLHRLNWRQQTLRLALMFGLGLGITFFYSGGALLEMDQVTLQQSTTTRNNDFRFNFTSLSEILAPVTPEDPTLINPPLLFRLGWMPMILAALGLASLVWLRQREQRWHVGLMAAATAVFLFMSLPVSHSVWEVIPLIDFVQFPWRFVGRAALPVAFLAGVPFASLRVGGSASLQAPERTNSKLGNTQYALRFTFYAAIGLLLLEALPGLYPNICPEEPFPTITNVHHYERETGLVGVDPEGSYFPRTVLRRPGQSPLEADYQANQMPERFDTATLPEGTIFHWTSYEPLSTVIHLDSPESFTARYFSFDFPGWVALVDGEPIATTPSNPEGLITFPVPAGEHTLIVRWQSTPLRTVLLGLSILSLAGAIVTAVMLASGRLHAEAKPEGWRAAGSNLRPTTCYLLLLLAMAMLGLKLAIDRVETPLRRAAAAPVANTLSLQAGELQFIGYNLSQDIVASGDTFDIDLAWTAVAQPAVDYQSNIWLAGPDGLVWSEKETHRPRLYEDAPRTRFWQPEQWAWDSREVQILSGTPPGQYDIVLTLFDRATLRPLTLLNGSGAVIGPTAIIGRITVESPPVPAIFKPQFPVREAVPGAGLTLLGFNQDRAGAIPGEEILLTLFWESAAGSMNSSVTIRLLDASGNVNQEWRLPRALTDGPLEQWPTGRRLRSQYLLRLPARLDSGAYRFVLMPSIPLGEIAVDAPQRLFTPPAVETAVEATFSDRHSQPQATLIGYTKSPIPNLQSPITLVWQSQTEFDTSYHVFIHLVDEAGQIVAQSDGQPANWTRPTTSWIPGEFIIDQHQLTLSENLAEESLSLRVGLYDPDTGERLPAETADFVTLPFYPAGSDD